MRRVDQDVTRFRRIVKGEIRNNLKRYVARGELIARQGDRTVSVPLPQINLPKFTFGDRGGGGVGQGEARRARPSGRSRARTRVLTISRSRSRSRSWRRSSA